MKLFTPFAIVGALGGIAGGGYGLKHLFFESKPEVKTTQEVIIKKVTDENEDGSKGSRDNEPDSNTKNTDLDEVPPEQEPSLSETQVNFPQESQPKEESEIWISDYSFRNLESGKEEICYKQVKTKQLYGEESEPKDVLVENCKESKWEVEDENKNKKGILIRTSQEKLEEILGYWDLSKSETRKNEKEWSIQSRNARNEKLKNLNFDCKESLKEGKVEVKCFERQASEVSSSDLRD